MKKTLLFSISIVSLFLTSCISVKQIGSVNMISTRNIDPNLKYKAISTYSGGSKKELKKTRATNIQDAINQTVKKVTGGDFLMNVKIYLVNKKYIAVEGDVWGSSTEEIAYRGFKVGDQVTWKVLGSFRTGIITSLKNDKTCLVQEDNTGETVEKKYDGITKISLTTTTNESSSIFNVGDKVSCWNMGKTIEGSITQIMGNSAVIEYTNSFGKTTTVKKDLSDLTKIKN